MKVLRVIGRKVCVKCGQKVQVEAYNYNQAIDLLAGYKICSNCECKDWANQKAEIVAVKERYWRS